MIIFNSISQVVYLMCGGISGTASQIANILFSSIFILVVFFAIDSFIDYFF